MMRQPTETENTEKLADIISSSSRIYTCLKQLIDTLSGSYDAQVCKCLLEGVAAALLRGESAERLIRRIAKKRNLKIRYMTSLDSQEAKKDVSEMKQLRRLASVRSLVPGTRKLERFHAEIVALHAVKASYRDIQLWLLTKRGFTVSHHSVQRYVKGILAQNISHEKE